MFAAFFISSLCLTSDEEQTVRMTVYESRIGSVFPRKGKWRFISIVNVPNETRRIFEAKPRGTLLVLRRITDGGDSRTAILAFSAATALADCPARAMKYYWMVGKMDVDKPGAVTRRTKRARFVKSIDEFIRVQR